MKNLLLILLFIILGAWYCYDKYWREAEPADGKSPRKESVAAADSEYGKLVANLEKRAAELFPTKIGERKKWIDDQLDAYSVLEKMCSKLPSAMSKTLLAAAAEKFPDDFDKQIPFVSEQSKAAAAIASEIASVELSDDASKKLIERLDSTFKGDYVRELEHLSKILEAEESFKRFGAGLSQQDIDVIRDKIGDLAVISPDKAITEFQNLARIRNNYLARTIPPQYGDLRKGIEEKFPGDFVAQSQELDRRVRAASLGASASALEAASYGATSSVSKRAADVFRKYIYIYGDSKLSYCGMFAKVKSKTVLVFPASILVQIGEPDFNLEFDERSATPANTYLSKDCGAAFMMIDESEGDSDSVPFVPDSEYDASSRCEVQIAVLSANTMEPISLDGVLKDGKIKVKEGEAARARGLGLVLDVSDNRILGFACISLGGGSKFYEKLKDYGAIDIGGKSMMKVEHAANLEKISKLAYKENPNTVEVEFFRPDALLNSEKFNGKSFAAQLQAIKSLAKNNNNMLRFIYGNEFGMLKDSKKDFPLVEKYDKVFMRRMSERTFINEYMRYFSEMLSVFKRDLQGVSEVEYYVLKEPYSYQEKLAQAAISSMSDSVGDLSNRSGILHTDLAECLSGDSFVPPRTFTRSKRSVEPASDVRIRMAN